MTSRGSPPLLEARSSGESGHLMAGLMAAIAILLIFSTVAFQKWEDILRRDNEAEMIFRAQEITRAIARFRKEQQKLPLKLEELIEPSPTTGRYFIRQLYTDPLVKDGKWGLLYMGPGGQIIDPASMPVEGGEAGLADLDPSAVGLSDKGPASQAASASAQSVEGLPIAGVRTLSADSPFRYYKGQSSYSLWLFTWLDINGGSGVPGAGQPGQPGQPGGLPGAPAAGPGGLGGAGGKGGHGKGPGGSRLNPTQPGGGLPPGSQAPDPRRRRSDR